MVSRRGFIKAGLIVALGIRLGMPGYKEEGILMNVTGTTGGQYDGKYWVIETAPRVYSIGMAPAPGTITLDLINPCNWIRSGV